jgi:hypothetical protein
VREFLLANSAVMVQDDSGIPLRFYDAKKWDLQPYGRYLGPIGVFPGRFQQDYAVLFKKSRAIDFGIGYRWQAHESNLLVAVKRPGESAAEDAVRSAQEDQGSETGMVITVAPEPSAARQRRASARHAPRSPLDWFRRLR